MNGLGMLLAQDSAAEVTTLEQPLFRDGSTLWLPPQSSITAPPVDGIFNFILWISVFFFLLILGLMIFYVIRYRRKVEGEGPVVNPTHNTTLELVWTIIPMILVVVMFVWAFRAYVYNQNPPSNSYQILVTGQKWNWLFEYPSNGAVTTTLAVPVDTPVELVMTSSDVTHSMYIPDFRVKKDVVPGRYSKLWFQATEPGVHHVFCTEYCGSKHSLMISTVEVMNQGDFDIWLAKAGDLFPAGRPYAEIGEQLYRGKGGCFMCHSVDGSSGTGPSWAMPGGGSIFGQEREYQDGGKGPIKTLIIDENYIRESILEPNDKVSVGYQGVMNTYRGILDDREITALIEFIKSLDKDTYEPKLVPEEEGADSEAAPDSEEPEAQPAPETAETSPNVQREVS